MVVVVVEEEVVVVVLVLAVVLMVLYRKLQIRRCHPPYSLDRAWLQPVIVHEWSP